MWAQGCDNLTRLWQPGYNLVTGLSTYYKVVTTLSQPCNKVVTISNPKLQPSTTTLSQPCVSVWDLAPNLSWVSEPSCTIPQTSTIISIIYLLYNIIIMNKYYEIIMNNNE